MTPKGHVHVSRKGNTKVRWRWAYGFIYSSEERMRQKWSIYYVVNICWATIVFRSDRITTAMGV